MHPCVTGDDVWDNVEPANDNAQGLILVVRHNVPQVGMFFPHARERLERKRKETSPRQGEAQLAQAHRAEQAGGWGLPKYRFTGKEEDVEVGLQYFGFRYLNPLLGRWISPDPLEVHTLGGSGELNVYAYISGAVLLNTDPLGLADGTQGQSGAGSGDGNETDKGYDPEGEKQPSGPQQEAAAQAEAERKKDSYLAGLEAGHKASDELHRPWENRHDQEKVAEKWEQIEAAKRMALATCGDACKGYEQDFNEAFDSGYRGQELHRSVDGLVKTAVYVGLAGAGSPKNSVGSGGVKPPPRTKSPPPSQGNLRGGTQTPPTLPQKQIASDGKVAVEHYYRSGDHPPAHAHVKGGGPDTKIGPNGKPVKGHPELTAAQRAVVEQNKSTIRRAVNKIGKWLKSLGDD